MTDLFKLLVKFKPEAISYVKNGALFFSCHDEIMRNAKFVLDVDYQMAVPELAATGELKCDNNGIDFSKYKGLVYINGNQTTEQLHDLAAQYKKLDFVEYVYLESIAPIEPPSMDNDVFSDDNASDEMENGASSRPFFSTTPDLTHYQTYHRHSPAVDVLGIDTEYAWSLGVTGRGIRMANIEWGHNFEHEDLVGSNFIELYRTTDDMFNDHGAAVASVTLARDNAFGLRGAAFNIDALYGISELPFGRVAGIIRGLLELRPGDIFSYQMQEFGRPNDFGGHFLVPPDFHPGVWDITQSATEAGIVVVMTAGNGGEDLSHPFYKEFKARGDNGAIRVGAGSQVGRHRLNFSTFDREMVHVQGWGEGVTAAGYGGLFNGGPNRRYTRTFSGTSSAGAIVAAAAVTVQSWYKENYGRVLTSQEMRSIMIQTGSPQGEGGYIGPLPNIRRVIEFLSIKPPFPLWEKHRNYIIGDRVSWNGCHWQLQLRNQGLEPGRTELGCGVCWQPLN